MRDKSEVLGTARARELGERLARLDPAAGAKERWELHVEAATAELILGHEAKAVEHFTAAYRLKDEADLVDAVRARTTLELGMAYMRLGETQNCCQKNVPDSCILPIRKGGVHTQRRGSTQAIRYFTEVLETTPDGALRQTAEWLLNIAYMTLGDYPGKVPPEFRVDPANFKSRVEFPRFTNIAPSLHLETFNLCGCAVVDDFDGDGYLDILTSSWDTSQQMRFFHSEGDGTFSDKTDDAGLIGLLGGFNMKQADFDNDGDLDVVILRGGWLWGEGRLPNSLLRNNGDATFTDVTFEAGLGRVHYPTQTAGWADYDNDGDLDLFIGNETGDTVKAPCQLFRNRGDGTFIDVAKKAGVQNWGYAKAVTWGDYDNDDWPDLYVSNYLGPNQLYHNKHDGTFESVGAECDVSVPYNSFPVWFWDFDNDGALDLFVTSYEYYDGVGKVAAHMLAGSAMFEHPRLYRGDGRGGFKDVAVELGLDRPMYPMGSNYGDLNNDGFLDFYLGTGDPDFKSLMPNLMFLNLQGKKFADVTMAGGFGHLQKGHGVAFADLDNDGDLDVYEQMGGWFPGDKFNDCLYENPGFGHHWIGVKLEGVKSNRSAIGARIVAHITENGQSRSIHRRVNSGGSFGANPLRQTIGLGKANRVDRLEIYWPTSGIRQIFRDVAADQIIHIVEDTNAYTVIQLDRLRLHARTDG
ncbi:MAG: FG-GAP-like repeat-containing protein [Phycisphaerae bacterium]